MNRVLSVLLQQRATREPPVSNFVTRCQLASIVTTLQPEVSHRILQNVLKDAFPKLPRPPQLPSSRLEAIHFGHASSSLQAGACCDEGARYCADTSWEQRASCHGDEYSYHHGNSSYQHGIFRQVETCANAAGTRGCMNLMNSSEQQKQHVQT